MTRESSWAPESLAQTGSGYDLRPLSTGEVLDRTFQLYRSRFALFASLAALPAAVNFVGGAVNVLVTRTHQVVRYGRVLTVANHLWLSPAISTCTLLLFLVVYGMTQAATTWAVAEIYLGKAATAGTAWKTATADWFRYVRVVLRQYWSIFWLPMAAIVAFAVSFAVPGVKGNAAYMILAGLLLFCSVIYAIYAGIRVSLAVPAAVLESLKANAAVRRSVALLTERKVRIFLLWLLLVAISLAISAAISPLQFLAVRAHGVERYVLQMLYLTGTFIDSMLVGPVGAIGLCLFYFDERVRHEGFDIEFLMQRAGGGAAAAMAQPTVEGKTSPEIV